MNIGKILIQDKDTNDILDITDLDKETYEKFLNLMNQLYIAYSIIGNKSIENTI